MLVIIPSVTVTVFKSTVVKVPVAPVFLTAIVPSPKLVLAVAALAKSDKLLALYA